jgi:hypothetical protein
MTYEQRYIVRRIEFIKEETQKLYEYIVNIRTKPNYWENKYVLCQLRDAMNQLDETGQHNRSYSLYLIDFHTYEKILIHEGKKQLADGNFYIIHPSGERGIMSPTGKVLL